MGFWQRLITLQEKIEPVRVALIGDDCPERKRLESAYCANPKTPVVFSGPAADLGKMIRAANAEWVEIFAPVDSSAELAEACLDAGLRVSLPMPRSLDLEKVKVLREKSRGRSLSVRVRNECLYYEPYQKARSLISEEKIGYPAMLRITVKRKEIPAVGFDAGRWLWERESDSFALAEWLCGPLDKVFVVQGESKTNPGSLLVGLKFKAAHRLGFLLVDFAPGLQIRTFNEPVFRQVWITGTAGVLMVNRGEGQLWRMPVLWLRAKDYSRTWEMLKDDWNAVYPAMVMECFNALRKNARLVSDLDLGISAAEAALAAGKALAGRKEIAV